MRNKFSSFKDLALNETNVCLLSKTKSDGSFPNSIERFEKIETKMVAVLCYT